MTKQRIVSLSILLRKGMPFFVIGLLMVLPVLLVLPAPAAGVPNLQPQRCGSQRQRQRGGFPASSPPGCVCRRDDHLRFKPVGEHHFSDHGDVDARSKRDH